MAESDKPAGDLSGEEKGSPVKRADKGTQKSDSEGDADDSNPNDGNGDASSVASASGGTKGDSARASTDRRKFRTITFGRRYKTKGKDPSKKRKGPWNFRLNCCRLRKSLDTDIPEPTVTCHSCVCTGYRRTEEHHLGAGVVFESGTPPSERRDSNDRPSERGPDYTRFTPHASDAKSTLPPPMVDLSHFNPKDYPTEDWDERARVERAREIEEGIEPPPGYQPSSPLSSLLRNSDFQLAHLSNVFQHRLSLSSIGHRPMLEFGSSRMSISSELDYERSPIEDMYGQRTVHTQIDYIHCLVPDLLEITNCSFYWGKMDRYEAEKLLENRPEGTFLLRDSAQEEYLFSVSFRRYGRSLHARIEQWNHKFSFDSHDPGVFASDTVCGLIEHYKDPSCCMFFEPMLTIPLHRTFAFPLQHLCRAVVSRYASYDGVNQLHLPKCLKSYLKEYHYKQRVRVRRFESEQ